MLREVALDGVLFAPIMLDALAALVLTLVLRSVLWRTGLARWVWHLPLLEVSVFLCLLFLLVRRG